MRHHVPGTVIHNNLPIDWMSGYSQNMRPRLKRVLMEAFRRLAGTVTHVTTDEPLVALTFDDGPDPVVTPTLLRILDAHGAKATFFMSGENAAAHPEVVAAVRKAGHSIGNHSWDHPSFPLITFRERIRQIRQCARVLQVSGVRLFRPPYGNQSAASQFCAWLTGHQVITWNLVLPDWLDHDAAWLAQEAAGQIQPGSIVLMHDGLIDFTEDRYQDRLPTVDAVEKILTMLGTRYRFITVPELLRRGTPVRVNWFMRPDVGFLSRLQRKSGQPRRYDTSADRSPWFGFNR